MVIERTATGTRGDYLIVDADGGRVAALLVDGDDKGFVARLADPPPEDCDLAGGEVAALLDAFDSRASATRRAAQLPSMHRPTKCRCRAHTAVFATRQRRGAPDSATRPV